MKVKNLVWFWALLLVLPVSARAQFISYTNNGAFIIEGCFGQPSSLTIPGRTNNLPVIIADNAFSGRRTLTNLTLLNGIENIGNNAFQNCTKLTNVGLPGSVTNIGSNAFYSCTSLTSVAIPGSITSIGSYAFGFCTALTNVVISNGVANLADGAFWASPVNSIIIPGSVTNIGASAFFGGGKLTSVTISNGVENIGASAFSSCGPIRSVTIPATVRTIGVAAFTLCNQLSNFTVDALNSNYASVGGVLFNKSLNTLVQCPFYVYPGSYVVPGSVTNIGPWAFAYSAMGSVTIPDGVTRIGDNAFTSCDYITSLAIPASVTTMGSNVCESCLDLTNITVEPANPAYASSNGLLFDKTFDTLISCPMGKSGSYAMPGSISTIASFAFRDSRLNYVTIGANVTNIGPWAFAYAKMSNLTIPGSIGTISSYAFFNCQNLTNVLVLNGVTSIGSCAFDACQFLTSVTIPASVQSIGPDSFEECSSLTNVYFLGNAPAADNTDFSQVPGIAYYLPGTTGWTANFAGLPTAPWYLPNPVILDNDAGLDGSPRGFGFTISWATNTAVVVEASTNLVSWQTVQTNTLMGGVASFNDPFWTNYSSRFYRLRSP